jgi:uncharacterized protein YndB with AHSA1/START domain
MTSTRVSQHIKAPRERVYRALLDAKAIATWKVPNGMTCHVHWLEPREGSAFLEFHSLTTHGPVEARQPGTLTRTMAGSWNSNYKGLVQSPIEH